jgi:hypothetical protein
VRLTDDDIRSNYAADEQARRPPPPHRVGDATRLRHGDAEAEARDDERVFAWDDR